MLRRLTSLLRFDRFIVQDAEVGLRAGRFLKMLKTRSLLALSRAAIVLGFACLVFFIMPHRQALARTCIPIHGLSFERIDSNKLLASREGRNVAIISISLYHSFPERLVQFRFFSANLCLIGAEGKFHIDGKLYTVQNIETFSQ